MKLTIENLQVHYQDFKAVDDVTLEIPSGQVTVIIGPNGCGKSTLLRSIARLHRPTTGNICWDDQDIWKLSPKSVAHHLTLLPQSSQAPEAIRVIDLVRYGRHPHQNWFRQWSKEDEASVIQSMEMTDILELAARRVDQLSGGQRQRCWLAMILAQDVPLMLLDEPTSMLDLGHQTEVLSLVKKLSKTGRTFVLVIHDLMAAVRFADQLVVMQNGRIVDCGAPQKIVTPQIIQQLYEIDVDIVSAPQDDFPIVIPKIDS